MNFQSREIKMLKIGQAAKLIGKHPQTLRRWEKKGYLRSVRMGKGARWYSIDQLQQFLPEKIGPNPEIKKGEQPVTVTINDRLDPQIFAHDFDDIRLIPIKSQMKILEHTITNNMDRQGILLLLVSMLLPIIIRLLYLLNVSTNLICIATELHQNYIEYISTLEIDNNPDTRIVQKDEPEEQNSSGNLAQKLITENKDTVWKRAKEKAANVYLALSKASVDQSLDEEERNRVRDIVRNINNPYQRATAYLANYDPGNVNHDVAALVLFHDPTDFGISRDQWSVRLLSYVCKHELGTKACSRSQVQRSLQRMKWNCKTRTKMMSPDKNYGKIIQQLGLLMCELNKGDLVLFGDEFLYSTVKVAEYKKQIRAAEGLNIAPPFSHSKPFYRSIASIQVAGLVDTTTNRLITKEMERKNYATFFEVLCLMTDYFRSSMSETSTIYIVLDNASYHRPEVLKREIKDKYGELVKVIFLPSYSSNHNPIERVWQFLLRNSLRCGEDEDELREELQNAVDKYHKTGTKPPKPLQLHCEICGHKWQFRIGENQVENKRSLQKHICFQIEGINPFTIHVLKQSVEHLNSSSFAYPFS